MDDGQVKDLVVRMHNIEKTLTDLQIAIARIEANQKTVSLIGGIAATAIAGVLAKLLLA